MGGIELPAIIITGQPNASVGRRALSVVALAVLEGPFKADEILPLLKASEQDHRP
jgi:hypothetical protein